MQNVHAEAGAKHPGKNGYRREKGKVEWIEQSAADEFIAKHGAEHPSNYKEQYGQDWEDDFFQPSGTPRIPARNTDISRNTETVKRRSKEACSDTAEEAGDFLASAHETIQRNPIPSVAGAFALGLAIGCLMISGRSQYTMKDRYIHAPLDHATDVITSTLNRLCGNFKFW